jgi:hypothetical protein
MPKGIPAAGFRVSRKTGKPLGQRAADAVTSKVATIKQAAIPAKSNETDEQILAKLKDRFSALQIMAESTAFGLNRSLIISGPAGLGKSYGVMKVLEEAEKKKMVPIVVKGFIRPTGLYKLLYENRFKKSIVVFDDADSIFADDVALNLLKAACDSTEKRRMSWLAETRMEDEDGERLPRSFEFEGSIIFITNYDFDEMISRGSRLAPHFEALISRSHYLDLALKTKRDYFIRIKQVIADGMLNESLDKKQQATLLKFIETNTEKLRELSLRMVIKLSLLMQMNPTDWERLAKITCMKGQ